MNKPEYKTTEGIPLTDYVADLIIEAGGIPEKYASRVTINRASTGEEENRNAIIEFDIDGKTCGIILATLNKPITYKGKEGQVFLIIDPDWSIVKTNPRTRVETIWGREIELYGDVVPMKDLQELFDFYDAHNEEIARLCVESKTPTMQEKHERP